MDPNEKKQRREEEKKHVRDKIQHSIEQAEKERLQVMLQKRIELARSGVAAFERNLATEAIKSFTAYLQILEDWKGVKPGGLTPALFDPQKDMAELLLISAVYWDLAKIYDRSRVKSKEIIFRQYLDKYILFSKDMSYQPLCAETLRKYIMTEKPTHKSDFKTAYKQMGGTNCFVATSLFDVSDPRTLGVLREFRDELLLQRPKGRAFVGWYYRVGPSVANRIDTLPELVRRGLGLGLDGLGVVARALLWMKRPSL